MNILLPTRWQKQPQTPVEIDWNHPLARGLTGLWILNGTQPYNIVTGERTVETKSSISRFVSSNGVGFNASANSVFQLTSNLSNLLNSNSGTILYFGDGSGATSGQDYLSHQISSTTSLLSIFGSLNTGTSQPRLGARWGTGVADLSQAENVSNTGKKNLVLVSDGSNLKLYKDGKLISTSSGAPTGNITTNPLYLGTYRSLPPSSFGIAVATWDRPLTPSQVQALSLNIYQILRPQKRMFIYVDLNKTFDFDLPLPSLDLSADLVLVEEGQQFFDLSLPLPALDISASMIKGEAIDLGLTLNAPDLFMDMGVVNRVSLSLPLPKVDLALTAFVGSTIDNIDLVVPPISFSGDLSNGAVMALDLPLPSIDIDLSFGEVLSLELPALDFSASMATGSVMALSLPMPSVDLSASLNTSSAFAVALELPAIDIALSAITGNVIAIDLPIDMPVIQGQLLAGNAMSLMLDIELDADLSLASSLMMDIDLDLPSLLFDAVMYGAQTRSGIFYNRWTQ